MDDQDFLQQCGELLLVIDKLSERVYRQFPLVFGAVRDRLAAMENKVLGGHAVTPALSVELEMLIERVQAKIAAAT